MNPTGRFHKLGEPQHGSTSNNQDGFLSLDLTEFETWILPLANHATNQTEQITFSLLVRVPCLINDIVAI